MSHGLRSLRGLNLGSPELHALLLGELTLADYLERTDGPLLERLCEAFASARGEAARAPSAGEDARA
jgi:hypothetical protein